MSHDEMKVAGWNEAIDAAAAIADREWVGENSLIGSKVARKIADSIRDLKVDSQSATRATPQENQ